MEKRRNLLLRSNFSSFPQYFQYISKIRSQITYTFVKCCSSIYFFLNSVEIMSRYGYIEVFQSPLEFEITRVDCKCFLVMCLINPFMSSGLFYLNLLDRSITYIRSVWLGFNISCFVEVSVLKANSVNVDRDQTPRSAASDLGLLFACIPFKGLYGKNG